MRSLVGDTLRSVVSQSYSDLEILCVDDGSTDGSGEILSEWAGRDKRIRVISRRNGGLGAARNSGLDVASGRWIAFLDAGDLLHRDAIKILNEAAVASGAEVAVSRSFVKARNAGEMQKRLSSVKAPCTTSLYDRPLDDLLRFKYAMSSVCNKLYRRECVGNVRFQEGVIFEDWPFLVKLFGEIKRFALVDNPLYGYVMTPDSITRSIFSEKKLQGYVSGIESVNAYYSEKGEVPRAALRRCAIAAKMMLGKVWHARSECPELPNLASREFWRLVHEGKIRVRDVSLKALARAYMMHCTTSVGMMVMVHYMDYWTHI